jgi:hypothetical protein
MNGSRRPPPLHFDRQTPTAKAAVIDNSRLVNARRPAQPEPIPGYQEFFARRFELALRLLDRHTHLASGRSNSALLLVLIDLLTGALSVYLYVSAANSGTGLLLLIILIFLLIVIWGFLLAAILFAISATIWRRFIISADIEAEAFFVSGEYAPTTARILQDQSQFSQQFRRTSQAELLTGAANALYACSIARKDQERRIRTAIFLSFASFLGLGLTVVTVLLGML